MSEEPIRWLDDPTLSASLRADLTHGATATVQGLDTSAGLVALRGAIGAQTSALGPAAASGSFAAKALVGVLVIGGGLGLWQATSSNDAGTESDVEPAALIEPVHNEPVMAPVRAAIPEESPPVADAPIVPEPPTAEVAPVVPSKRDDRSDRRRDDLKPSATPDVETSDAESGRGRDREDRYLQEATLVARARKSLASDPKLTLALTDQIANEFPSGQLVEERRALAIRALAKLGRLDEAKDRATDFLADHAQGAHAAAVRRAIGEMP